MQVQVPGVLVLFTVCKHPVPGANPRVMRHDWLEWITISPGFGAACALPQRTAKVLSKIFSITLSGPITVRYP